MHAMVLNALHMPLAWTELPDRLPAVFRRLAREAAVRNATPRATQPPHDPNATAR